MHIVIIHNSKIPVLKYGGTERVIWYLGEELVKRGNKVTYLAPKGSYCEFANVIPFDSKRSINSQVPESADFLHIHFNPHEKINVPHLITIHGNLAEDTVFHSNTSFVSENHARRYGADAYVYNGLNWDDYDTPNLTASKNYVHFLAKAAWRVKNVRGAIKIAESNKTPIKIMGGSRINLKMGLRITLSRWATFYGTVDNRQKCKILNYSKALIFPVLWHEPMGLALIESLYFGCPVLATKYGAIPEIITKEFGILSNSKKELTSAFENLNSFNRRICNQYVVDQFSSKKMTDNYVILYERILNGEKINSNRPHYSVDENKLETFL